MDCEYEEEGMDMETEEGEEGSKVTTTGPTPPHSHPLGMARLLDRSRSVMSAQT